MTDLGYADDDDRELGLLRAPREKRSFCSGDHDSGLRCQCGRKTTCGCSGIACAIIAACLGLLTLALLLVNFLVVLPALAQTSLDNAGLTITSMSLANFRPDGDGFDIRMVGTLDNRSPLESTMHEASSSILFNDLVVGTVTIPEQVVAAGSSKVLDIQQTVTVSTSQQDAFFAFSKALLNEKEVEIEMKASIGVTAGGMKFSGLSLSKTVTINGFGSFLDPAPVVTRTAVVGSTENTISMEIDIALGNPATAEMLGIGVLEFVLASGNTTLGVASTTGPVNVTFGSNTYTTTATLTRPTDDAVFREVLSNYTSGKPSIITLYGNSTDSNPILLKPALESLTTAGVLPGVAPLMVEAVGVNFHLPNPSDYNKSCAITLGNLTQNTTFQIDYVLQNVLDVPLKVTKLDLNSLWKGTRDDMSEINPNTNPFAAYCATPEIFARVLNGYNTAPNLEIPARGQVVFHQSMCDTSGEGNTEEELAVYTNFSLCIAGLSQNAQEKSKPFTMAFAVTGQIDGCIGAFCTSIKYDQDDLAATMIVPPPSDASEVSASIVAMVAPGPEEEAGPCTAGDAAIVDTVTFSCDAVHCAKKNFFGVAGTAKCLEAADKVSAACATCFGKVAQCGATHCALQCLADPESDKCQTCGHAHCDAAALTCGAPLPPNPKNCK